MIGSIGHAGAFSFNYFKNMTCGEGGAVVTNDNALNKRARCLIDCCNFYWTGRPREFRGFTSNGSRASEIEGAMLNAQLDRLAGMNPRLAPGEETHPPRDRGHRPGKPPQATALTMSAAAMVMYLLPTATQAARFAERSAAASVARPAATRTRVGPHSRTTKGRITPRSTRFNLPQNRRCRKTYSKQMLPRSLAILNRTAMIGTHPDHKPAEVNALIKKIKAAAKEVLLGNRPRRPHHASECSRCLITSSPPPHRLSF